MKRIKAIACVISVAMLAGIFAGCSKTTKITTEKFQSVCEKLDLEEFEPDGDGPEMDDLEDGIFAVIDEDYIEDNEDDLNEAFTSIGLSDVFEAEDVESFAFAAKASGLDGFEDIKGLDDIEDLEVDGAFALQMTLKDDKLAEDFMDYVDDMLDYVDINTKDLTSREYLSSKNEGYFRFHIDLAKFGALLLENDDLMDMFDEYDIDTDDFEDAVAALSGDVAVSIEISGNQIFVIAGLSINSKCENLNSFAKAFGAASNPASLPVNEKVCEEIVDNLSDSTGDIFYYIYMAEMYSSSYSG